MFVTAWSSWPAESIEIDQRPEGKSRRRFTGTPAAEGREQDQATGSLARLLPGVRWGVNWFLVGAREGGCPGVRLEAWVA